MKEIKSIASDSNKNSINFEDNIKLKNGDTIITVNQDGLDLGSKKLLNIKDGVNDSDGVNYGQIKNFIKKSDIKPITFLGDEGSSNIELGDKFTVKGEAKSNITVRVNNKNAEIKLNKLENVEKDSLKTVSSNGIFTAIKNSKTKGRKLMMNIWI